jgi:hypothetical protein
MCPFYVYVVQTDARIARHVNVYAIIYIVCTWTVCSWLLKVHQQTVVKQENKSASLTLTDRLINITPSNKTNQLNDNLSAV